MKKLKHAFTLLEVVIVIVVIGILSAVFLPRLNQNRNLSNAAYLLISDIQYTQHLALMDDIYSLNNATDWYKARWQIYFKDDASGSGKLVYTIYQDKDLNSATNPDKTEIAKDPLTSKLMSGDSLYGSDSISRMNLGKSYKITQTSANIMSGGCQGSQRIFFDYLGRPYSSSDGVVKTLIKSECIIKLSNPDGTVDIAIEPETGYTHIKNVTLN